MNGRCFCPRFVVDRDLVVQTLAVHRLGWAQTPSTAGRIAPVTDGREPLTPC